MGLVVHLGSGMTDLRHALLVAFATLSAACGSPDSPVPEAPFARPSGYWEGNGKLTQVDFKDRVKEMTRSATYTFWFTVDAAGEVRGEVDVTWDALLRVDGLSQFSFPLPMAGGVSINPKVGGFISDPDPTRKYPLRGRLENGTLTLEAAFGAEPKPILFSLKADPGVMGGNGVKVTEMPMKPFPFFAEAGAVQKRPHGPHAARTEVRDETLAVEWNARQITTEERR